MYQTRRRVTVNPHTNIIYMYTHTCIYITVHAAGVLEYFPVDGRSMPGDEENSSMLAISGIPGVLPVRKRNKSVRFADKFLPENFSRRSIACTHET